MMRGGSRIPVSVSDSTEHRTRWPKDLAGTLRTVACVETLLDAEGLSTPHQWEARHYGTRPKSWWAGPKTRGSMARSRSGQFVASHERVAEWGRAQPSVVTVARSWLWGLLRCAEPIPATYPSSWFEDHFEETAFLAFHDYLPLMAEAFRAPATESIMTQLAACRSFDAVAAMWLLLLEAINVDPARALSCARYVPPALALLAQTPGGRRVALPILARMRQLTLDQIRVDDRQLQLHDYDLPSCAESARHVPGVRVEVQRRRRRLFVSDATRDWIATHLGHVGDAPLVRPWTSQLGPLTHPSGPCLVTAGPRYHRDALARLRRELGVYA